MQPMHKLCVGKGMHAAHGFENFFFHHLVTWQNAMSAFANMARCHTSPNSDVAMHATLGMGE
jgi:hypothetical protein